MSSTNQSPSIGGPSSTRPTETARTSRPPDIRLMPSQTLNPTTQPAIDLRTTRSRMRLLDISPHRESARSRDMLRVIHQHRQRSLSSHGSVRTASPLIDLNTPPGERRRGRLSAPVSGPGTRQPSGSPWLIHLPGASARFDPAALTDRLQATATLIDQGSRPPTPNRLEEVVVLRTLLINHTDEFSQSVGEALDDFQARLMARDPRDQPHFLGDVARYADILRDNRDLLPPGHAAMAINDLNVQSRHFRLMAHLDRHDAGHTHLGELQAPRSALMDSRNENSRLIGEQLHTLHAALEEGDDDAFHDGAAALRQLIDDHSQSLPTGHHETADSDLTLMTDVFASRQMNDPQSWDDLRVSRFMLSASENATSRLVAAGLNRLSDLCWEGTFTVEGLALVQMEGDSLRSTLDSVRNNMPDEHYQRAVRDIELQVDAYLHEVDALHPDQPEARSP